MKNIITVVFIVFFGSISANAQTPESYFKIAAKHNPGLQAKYLNFEVALQKVAQVGSLPDPNLSFGYFVSPVETRVGPQNARFSLTQLFPWFGTLKAQKDVAALTAEARYKEFIDARNKLFYRVAAAYYLLFELHRLISIEKKNTAILKSYKDIANIKFQNGKGSMVDVLRVDIMLNDATTHLLILNQQKKPLETHFNKLLNRAENEPIAIVDTLRWTALDSNYRKDSLLVANPLLDEIDLKIQAGKAKERAAVKQGLPKLGVGVDYVIVSKRTDAPSLSDNGKDIFMPKVTVSIPLFRSKYKASQREAQLIQQSLTLEKEELSNQLTSSYEKTWFEVQKQASLIRLFRQQIKESQQSLHLLFIAYGNSGRDFEEVLRMQQQVLKYQKMKASALARYHTALAEMDYVTAKTQ